MKTVNKETKEESIVDYEVNRDLYQDLLKRRENARVSMNLDAEQRARLLEIASRCPVHRTLTGEVLIETKEGA